MSQKQKEMFREQELAEIGKAISEGGNGECLQEILHNVLKDRPPLLSLKKRRSRK